MAELLNSFEGGSDAVAITTANSGGSSGDAFDVVTSTGSATANFETSQSAHGSLSGEFAVATTENAHVEWDATSWQAETEVWSRFYIRLTDATPASNFVVCRFENANTMAAEVQLRTGGTLALRDSLFTLRYETTATLSDNTWYRVEVHVVHSATVGHLELRLFADIDSTTATETIGNLTDNWDTEAQSDSVRYGIGSNPGQTVTGYLDDIGVSDVDWMGPAAVAVFPPFLHRPPRHVRM